MSAITLWQNQRMIISVHFQRRLPTVANLAPCLKEASQLTEKIFSLMPHFFKRTAHGFAHVPSPQHLPD